MQLLLAVTAGFVVANNYYSQPLLGEFAREFQVSEAAATWVSSVTQFGYALGLLLLLPLGDMFDRRRLISVLLAVSGCSLILFGLAQTYAFILPAGLLVGFTSIVPQTLPPIASQLAGPKEASRAVGQVMAGLLLGIVLSRFVGGWAGEYLGWRNLYFAAAALMVCLLVLLRRSLAPMPATYSGSYHGLMGSLWKLWGDHKPLRRLSMAAALQFGAFSLFWGTVGFHLSAMPQKYPPSVTGTLALIGAGGVIAALFLGRITARFSTKVILVSGGLLMVASFGLLALATESLFWTVPAVVLLDLGMQVSHVTSMASVLKLDRSAMSRLNTVYMVVRFLGAAVGTYIGGVAWGAGGWVLTCAIGGGMCVLGTVLGLMSERTAVSSVDHYETSK
ncbi:MFS transporter [Rhizobium sp. 2MFCol3.1]|uniref:MFS transporter n=1 Tax=Rhizobium sp. 2MFCol3.1 TaxID=1246459 RepID=UPI000362D855|nr:MFS transporter [Rhizobium sp. 2MFCol3.1]